MRRLIGLVLAPFGALMLLWCSPALAAPGFTHIDTAQGCRTYTVPTSAASASISAVGAGGGAPFATLGYGGGSGGSVTGQIPVTGGQSLYVCVNVGGGAANNAGSGTYSGAGGGASGVALGSDFSSPLVVAGGGGGADVGSGGNAGYPAGANGDNASGTGGGGGTATAGGSGGTVFSSSGDEGARFNAAGPGSGGVGVSYGGGGGAGYYGGGGGAGLAGGGGGSDYCDASVSDCQTSPATSGPSVTIQYLAPQSITLPSTAVTYGQADFSPASSDSGLTVSYSNPSGQCSIDSGLLRITGAGSCTVTADQSGDDQYAPATSVTQTFQINPATLHVDADAASVGYGSPDPAASSTLRTGDFVGSDTAQTSGITGTASCSIASHAQDAGTYTGKITCQPGTLSSPNYTFAAGNNSDLTIDPAVVHVDANAASVGYGSPDPAASSTLRTGDFVGSDTAQTSGITGTASCSIASHAQDAGTYTGKITCQPGTLSSPNYTFAAGNNSDLTIDPAVVHVDANAASVGYGQPDPTATSTLRTADFIGSDTAQTSGITGTASCSIASHAQDAGTYTGKITCQPGTLSSPNYTFAAGTSADLTIDPAVLHVDANAASVGYGQPDPTATSTLRTADFIGSDTAQTSGITGTASCSIANHTQDAGTYTGKITCQPGTLSSPNYTFAAGNNSDLTIDPAVLHVDANAASIGYGQPDPTATSTLRTADFIGSDTAQTSGITGTASCSIANHTQDAGTYTGKITCQPGTLSSPNYTFTAGTGADLTINPAVLHVDANAASIGYGQPDPTATSTLRTGDFVNGDTPATSGISGAASCSIASHAQSAGTYTDAITCQPSTLTASNYTFAAGTSADLTIKPAPINPPPPPPSSTPSPLSVTGAAEQGNTLKVSGQRPGATYSYQWVQYDSAGANPKPIRGATGPSYTLTLSDVGHIVRVIVSGSDGQSTLNSAITHVVEPSNRLAAAPRITTLANGTFIVRVKVPGPGVVNILETAWHNSLAHTVRLLQPARGRFVFARAHATATHHGTLSITVHPNKAARQLLAHHTHPITLRLWVTYTPQGGRSHSTGYYGLKLAR